MSIESNKEAMQMLKNTLGSLENRMREAYNKGYKDGVKDGINQAMQKVADAILNEAEQTEPQTDMAEDIVRSFGFNVESYRQAKAKTEPQTDCGDFADRLAYERGVKHAWEVAQKVFDSTVTFYEAEDVAKQIDKDINVRSKDEPQKWTKENCKGCKYNEYPYDSGTCFVRVCINGNKYEPKE